jgi:hypothetical protein
MKEEGEVKINIIHGLQIKAGRLLLLEVVLSPSLEANLPKCKANE